MFKGTIPIDPGAGQTAGGLWALDFGISGSNGSPNTLYFSDGIDGETNGLFGDISAVPAPELSSLPILGWVLFSGLRWFTRRRRTVV